MFNKIIPILSVLVIIYLFNSCEREVYSTQPAVATIKNSKIILKTNPLGAAIYLDGKNMGLHSPDSLTWLKPGTHVVTLKLGLFPDRSRNYNVQDSSRFTYDYNFYQDPDNYGGINITSTPSSASIILNDTLLNQKTPLTLNNLLPNTYKVKVSYPYYRSDSSFIDVRGGTLKTASFILEDTTKWISYSLKNSLIGSNYLTAITIDLGGNLWIGSREGYIYLYKIGNKYLPEDRKWSAYNTGYPIQCLAVDQWNNLWIGTSNSLRYFEDVTKMDDFTRFLPVGASVNSITIDKDQNVWIGTSLGLVILNGEDFYNSSNWKTYTANSIDQSVVDDYITSVSFDQTGNSWIGTKAGIQENPINSDFTYYNVFNMLNMNLTVKAGNFIEDIKIDKNGNVWVVHKADPDRGGITQFDGKSWSVVNLPGLNFMDFVYAYKIYVDKNNYKWISTLNGLWKYMSPNDWTSFTTANSKIPASQISDCLMDRKGNLWVATFGGGLGKLKKGNF